MGLHHSHPAQQSMQQGQGDEATATHHIWSTSGQLRDADCSCSPHLALPIQQTLGRTADPESMLCSPKTCFSDTHPLAVSNKGTMRAPAQLLCTKTERAAYSSERCGQRLPGIK